MRPERSARSPCSHEAPAPTGGFPRSRPGASARKVLLPLPSSAPRADDGFPEAGLRRCPPLPQADGRKMSCRHRRRRRERRRTGGRGRAWRFAGTSRRRRTGGRPQPPRGGPGTGIGPAGPPPPPGRWNPGGRSDPPSRPPRGPLRAVPVAPDRAEGDEGGPARRGGMRRRLRIRRIREDGRPAQWPLPCPECGPGARTTDSLLACNPSCPLFKPPARAAGASPSSRGAAGTSRYPPAPPRGWRSPRTRTPPHRRGAPSTSIPRRGATGLP